MADKQGLYYYTKDEIDELFGNTSWTSLNSTIKYRKKAGIVFLDLASYGTKDLTANDWTTIGTLPEGFRPSTTIHFDYANFSGTDDTKDRYGTVDTNGAVRLWDQLGGDYWVGSVCFPDD